MDHQYLINPYVNKQSEGLLFSDLSGPYRYLSGLTDTLDTLPESLVAYRYPRTISKNFVHYLRILLSSFGEEDF